MKPKRCCTRCAAEFEPRAVTGRPARYCSPSCSHAARLARQNAARRVRSLHREVERLEHALATGSSSHVMLVGASGVEFVPIADRLTAARAAVRLSESSTVARGSDRGRGLPSGRPLRPCARRLKSAKTIRNNRAALCRLLNKKNDPMPEPTWVRVADRLPKDGQVVLVRGKLGAAPTRAIFRAKPVGRWDVETYTYQLQRFEYWAPLP